MSDRLKVFGIVAILGFLAGVIAQVTADYLLPWLLDVVPELMQVRFLVTGFAGACLTLGLVGVWAHFTASSDR